MPHNVRRPGGRAPTAPRRSFQLTRINAALAHPGAARHKYIHIQKSGPVKGRLYHHEYMNLGTAVPRQVDPEGVVETGCRPFIFLLLLKGDCVQGQNFAETPLNVNLIDTLWKPQTQQRMVCCTITTTACCKITAPVHESTTCHRFVRIDRSQAIKPAGPKNCPIGRNIAQPRNLLAPEPVDINQCET